MEKKFYTKPQLDVIVFCEDVILGSVPFYVDDWFDDDNNGGGV